MPRKSSNTFEIRDGVAYVDVSTPKFPGAVMLIDEADLPLIVDGTGRWCAYQGTSTVYCRRGRYIARVRRGQDAHRVITGVADRRINVDHENHNGLDNRRSNLRPSTCSQNHANTFGQSRRASQFKGVTPHHSRGWCAQITVNRQRIYLGYFTEPADAAKAYDAAAIQHFGQFARINFPEAA